NSIHDNAGRGINLGVNGGNNGQTYPVLTAADLGSTTHVVGSLTGTPNSTFTVDFYASVAADPSGFGEGGEYLGSAVVTTNAGGNAAFDVNLAGASASNTVVTATATDSAGNTSAFSAAVGINHVPTATVTLDNHSPR